MTIYNLDLWLITLVELELSTCRTNSQCFYFCTRWAERLIVNFSTRHARIQNIFKVWYILSQTINLKHIFSNLFNVWHKDISTAHARLLFREGSMPGYLFQWLNARLPCTRSVPGYLFQWLNARLPFQRAQYQATFCLGSMPGYILQGQCQATFSIDPMPGYIFKGLNARLA